MGDRVPIAVLWRQRWLIVGVVAVFAVTAALVSSRLQKVYATTNTLLVTVNAPDQTFDTVQAAQAFSRSYADLITSPNIARTVASRLQDGTDANSLASAISVEAVPETQLMKVTAEDPSPARAKRIADTYAAVFVDYVRRTLSGPTKASIVAADPATVPDQPIRPRKALYVLVAFIFGLVAACALAFGRDRLDRRLRATEDVEARIAGNLPILGRIPERGRSHGSAAAFREAHQVLRKNLEFARDSGSLRSIAITSASEREGKTTTIAQLARATAELGLQVLIVEADFRFPSIQSELAEDVAATLRPGLSEYLDGSASFDEIIEPVGHYGVFVVPAGIAPVSGSALLESSRGREAVAAFLTRADFVLVDCPPVNAGADASILARLVDGVIVVVDLKRATDQTVSAALRQLRTVRSAVLGLVINRDPHARPRRGNHGVGVGHRARDTDDLASVGT
jgi:capsular exopolysaccharide synthesis family protein